VKVLVVGGGVSGLATGHHLKKAGHEVLLLESDARPGGKIRTDTDGNCVRERGPNGFLDNVPETLDLVRELGLESRLRKAPVLDRFLFRGAGLWKIPANQGEFLRSGLLSFGAKLRILWEPFAKKPPEGDESVFDFAKRRIGEEPARILVDAMVAGIYAGDSREISLESAFPKMKEMEREHGSLIRAMRKRKSSFMPAGTLTTFDGGMQVLTDALAERLAGNIKTGKRAMGLAREGETWVVQSADGETFRTDAVVVATPAPDAAMLLGRFDPRFRPILEAIPMAPVVVVTLRYPESAAPKAKAGFGFLVPKGEPCRLLGVLFDSTVFAGRAPAGEVLLRAMVGGARAPELANLLEADIVALVREDLQRSMSIDAEPTEVRVFKWMQGIPQYTVGHGERLARLEEVRASHRGLLLTGNSYRGISMNLCCKDAVATAGQVQREGAPGPGRP
jgi:oxygen-dependent protoporphyrinogen oxidase